MDRTLCVHVRKESGPRDSLKRSAPAVTHAVCAKPFMTITQCNSKQLLSLLCLCLFVFEVAGVFPLGT